MPQNKAHTSDAAPKMGIFARLGHMFEFRKRVRTSGAVHERGPVSHVIIMDGTLSSLVPGLETNAGLAFKLCCEAADHSNMLVRYEAGIQWRSFKDTWSVIEGRGINEQIRRVYGALASRYRPGDKIFLFGYSRGAYAVRSLSGFIDRVGLLKAEEATQRNVQLAYRHYQVLPEPEVAKAFSDAHCHQDVTIEMVGVWDTVAALGMHFPILWRFSSVFHEFYDQMPAKCVRRAYQALAYHERRTAYEPVLWKTNPDAKGQILQQMWFRGTHGDVGGQLSGYNPDRRLSNTTFVWMLDKAEGAGLYLPNGWRSRYLADPHGKSIGMNKGWAKYFWLRRRRVYGQDPSEVFHPSIRHKKPVRKRWLGRV